MSILTKSRPSVTRMRQAIGLTLIQTLLGLVLLGYNLNSKSMTALHCSLIDVGHILFTYCGQATYTMCLD